MRRWRRRLRAVSAPSSRDEADYPQEQQQYGSSTARSSRSRVTPRTSRRTTATRRPVATPSTRSTRRATSPQAHMRKPITRLRRVRRAVRRSVRHPVPPGGVAGSRSVPRCVRAGVPGRSGICPGAPANAPDRVGFDRPGPAPSSSHAMTNAGLPRRGSTQQPQSEQQWQQPAEQDRQAPQSDQTEAPGNSISATGSEDWRSTNDERWQRAEKLRDPKAGGVTSSGLPRRVPKANLIEGTAEQTPAGRPPGLPRPGRRARQVEQPAARCPAGTQRGNGHERTGLRPGQYLQPGALV